MTFDAHRLQQLDAERKRWEYETLYPTLNRLPERQDTFTTQSSVPVERIYTPLDVRELDHIRDLGMPGEYPFTRSIHEIGRAHV